MSTYRIEDTRDLQPMIRKLDQFRVGIRRHFERAMWESVLTLEAEVKERTPVGVGDSPTGHLRASISSDVVARDNLLRGIVGSPAEYALPVEEGTRPHFPPPSALVSCVHFKLGVSNAEARGVAFLVARKISRTGTKGVFMFDEGWKAARPKLRRYFSSAFYRAWRSLK